MITDILNWCVLWFRVFEFHHSFVKSMRDAITMRRSFILFFSAFNIVYRFRSILEAKFVITTNEET